MPEQQDLTQTLCNVAEGGGGVIPPKQAIAREVAKAQRRRKSKNRGLSGILPNMSLFPSLDGSWNYR